MSDSYRVTSRRSWGGRIGDSIKGILVGVVLFVAAFPVLWLNEGRAVETAKALREGKGKVVSLDRPSPQPALEGDLIHFTGRAVTDDEVRDPIFGFGDVALQFLRDVSMYQWKENERTTTRTRAGGSEERVTEYTYEKVWSDRVIDSGRFHRAADYRNPGSMPYSGDSWIASEVTVGDFQLSDSQVGRIGGAEPFPVRAEDAPASLGSFLDWDGGLYLPQGGGTPQAPEIGDVRIGFKVVRPTDVSVVGEQRGGRVVGHAIGRRTIEMISRGVRSADEMFEEAERRNRMITWLLRGLGLILMTFGLSLVLRPLSVFADVLPLLGRLVGKVTGVFAFMISAGLSGITIAVAWIVYRPLLGVAILVVAVAAIVAGFRLTRKPAAEPAPAS